MISYFDLCRRVAIAKTDGPKRHYLLGAVARRADGALVTAANGPCTHVTPQAHAEHRISRKLTPGSTVWVARVRRSDGTFANARPCKRCQNTLSARGVRTVHYTISDTETATLNLR